MFSRDTAFVEDEESHSIDDWSTATIWIAPEPSAPSESDLVAHLSSENDGTGMEEEEAYPMAVDDTGFPPALPVAVMESTQPPNSPVALYDYQRDRLVYSPNTSSIVVAEVSSERDFEYPSAMSSLQQSGNWGQEDNSSEEEPTAVVSGVAGAVVGTLVLGTLPGVIVGFYAAYVHGQPGAAGDISRALGEIALVAREKAIVVDRKHNLVARTKVALAEAWERAKLLDRQHHIIRRIKDFAKFSLTMTLHFIRRNSLLENNTKQNRARQCQRPRPVPVSSNCLEQRQPEVSCRHRQDSYQRAGAVPLHNNPIQARYC